MTKADLEPSPRSKVGVIVLVAVLHVVAVLALIRAFAPDFATKAVESVVSTFTVTVTAPPPDPAEQPEEAGAAAEAGKKAKPRPENAPKPKVAFTSKTAPKAASSGNDDNSGAKDAGAGTGAGGQGSGTGSGTGGDGQGGGRVGRVEKIAGDINSARDYPKKSKDLRIDDYVIVTMTVGTDGRARNCRVQRPSRDPEADRITCKLAVERFRFRPATNTRGEAVESSYGWKQRWFYGGRS